jgi:hypothetical protein
VKKMDQFRVVAMIFCLSLVAVTFLPSAKASEWNRKTTVTFSAPVEVPGVGAQTLPAGTYVFKIVDSQSNRHIVQVFSEDEKHVFTTVLAIPNYRLKPTDKTVMTFGERAAGQPEAIRAWFYPGRQWGEEFVYPKFRAVELAKITNLPILATPIELNKAPVEALKTAPVVAVKPTGEVVEMAEVVEPPPAAAPVEVAAAKSLPETASPLPLVGLIGLLLLGTGFAVSAISKRTV